MVSKHVHLLAERWLILGLLLKYGHVLLEQLVIHQAIIQLSRQSITSQKWVSEIANHHLST